MPSGQVDRGVALNNQEFKKTKKQKEAIKLLGGIAKYVNLYGGSWLS